MPRFDDDGPSELAEVLELLQSLDGRLKVLEKSTTRLDHRLGAVRDSVDRVVLLVKAKSDR